MAEPSPQWSLAVGDRVVYPNQGICRVFGVESKEIAGQTLVFVSMKREEDGAVVMVPQPKLQAIGLRRLAAKADIDQVYEFLRSDSDRATLDWKQRARNNLDRMTQGGVLGLAEVVKGLQVLSELRPLPAKERGLYDNARHLLVNEISAALGIPECDAEDSIDLVLFPVGRERPKRTIEEFQNGEDGLELGDDLLSLEDPLDVPEEGEEASAEDERAPLSDDDVTQPAGSALLAEKGGEAPKKKRGRPPKPKEAKAAEAPKKRGRPPKAKPAVPAAPKKRGRPPKAKDGKK